MGGQFPIRGARMPPQNGNIMTSWTESSALTEYTSRARTILFVGLTAAFIGSTLGVAISFMPGSIGGAELWLIVTCEHIRLRKPAARLAERLSRI